MFKKFKPSGPKAPKASQNENAIQGPISPPEPIQKEINSQKSYESSQETIFSPTPQQQQVVISPYQPNQMPESQSPKIIDQFQSQIWDHTEYLECLNPHDSVVDQIFNDEMNIGTSNLQPAENLQTPSEFCNIISPDTIIPVINPNDIDNMSVISNLTTRTTATKKSIKSMIRKTAMNPELIKEGVDPFNMPLKELVLKIPASNPIIKNETAGYQNRMKYESLVKINEKKEEEEEEEDNAPEVLVDADGNMIINESSLFIKPKSDVKLNDHVEFEDEDTYQNYSKPGLKNHKWLPYETKKFYICLQMVGLDFDLMSKLLKTKNRKQCLSKYKKEYKTNPDLVDSKLKDSLPYDSQVLESLEIALDSLPKNPKKKSGKSRARKKSYET